MLALHARAIEEFGGLPGVRDTGALEAALRAVENLAYDEQATLSTCAAMYAYHLTQAHAFLDGNKGVAAAVAEVFLELNGAELRALSVGRPAVSMQGRCGNNRDILTSNLRRML